jgi:hypothetical protein
MDGSVDGRMAELKARDSQAQLMRTLIEQRNPQDFSGAPLPSGHSVDSRAMGSTQDSRYSAASGQPPPSSLAGASRATVNSRREGRRTAAAPYPPSNSSGSGADTSGEKGLEEAQIPIGYRFLWLQLTARPMKAGKMPRIDPQPWTAEWSEAGSGSRHEKTIASLVCLGSANRSTKMAAHLKAITLHKLNDRPRPFISGGLAG